MSLCSSKDCAREAVWAVYDWSKKQTVAKVCGQHKPIVNRQHTVRLVKLPKPKPFYNVIK